jgi:hypothetical protein
MVITREISICPMIKSLHQLKLSVLNVWIALVITMQRYVIVSLKIVLFIRLGWVKVLLESKVPRVERVALKI